MNVTGAKEGETLERLTVRHEARVRAVLDEWGPLEAYRRLLAENDERIRGRNLSNGRDIVTARSALHTQLVRHWAERQHRLAGYDRPFAVVALGGTGRGEVAPRSDLDFAFLFDDALEGNPFLLRLQGQLMETGEFEASYGFAFEPLPFNLDDPPRLVEKQLNSFLDLRPVYDPEGLSERYLERIRSTYDPFEHFLHVRGFWKGRWEKAASEFERVDRFDIKNDGLRVFLAGIWTLAGKAFRHSHRVYASLPEARDLEAYDFLMRIRCFIHLRRGTSPGRGGNGNHPEDLLGFEDFLSFDELAGPEVGREERTAFADGVRVRLLAARRRVALFAKSIIDDELKQGRTVGQGSPIVYGIGGLYHRTSGQCRTPEEMSRAALSLVLASQHYGVSIDPAELLRTFRDVGDWLEPVPELASLFYEPRGSLADSFEFLCQFEGAEERLFPGYAKFEASLDERVMTEREFLRGALARRKLRALDNLLKQGREMLERAVKTERLTDLKGEVRPEVEAALLGPDHLAAVKLALKVKRLPVTPDDEFMRGSPDRPADDRYSSGLSNIPLSEYFAPYRQRCGFTEETLRVAQFLLRFRRAFKQSTLYGINPAPLVEDFVRQCGDEVRLRSLFVFTCADRAEWEGPNRDPSRWFLTRELYRKAMKVFRPRLDPAAVLAHAGFAPEEEAILRDFGPDFFDGVYGVHALTYGSPLLKLARQTAFFADDLTEVIDWLARLRQGADPRCAWLRDRLPDVVRPGAEHEDRPPLPVERLAALARALTQLGRGDSGYDPERYRDVVLRPETRRLIEPPPGGEDPRRLFRLLMEDAFPGNILRAPAAGPRALLLRDGASVIIGVAARDFRGLAACATGALFAHGLKLRQAHLFSAMHYGLALDFFHIEPGDTGCGDAVLRDLEGAILDRRYIAETDEAGLPPLKGVTSLQEWQPGEHCLRHETSQDAPGVVYALAYRVYRHLRANIFGLSATARRGKAYVSIYLSLPRDLDPTAARDIVARRFGD